MTVKSAYLEGEIMDAEVNDRLASLASSDDVQKAIIFNSTAFIETGDDGKDAYQGNVTEIGLLKYLNISGCPVKDHITEREQQKPIFTIPFSSARKRATTVCWINGGSKVRVFCKGAPEMVIKSCESQIGAGGQVIELTSEDKNYCTGTVQKQYADKCLRTLLIAYADYDQSQWEQMTADNNNWETQADQENVEMGLTMAGIFGLKDPLRDGIREAVLTCKKAGINVRMVTGDQIDTARAISLEAGILSPEDLADQEDAEYVCMTGADFRNAVGGSIVMEETEKEVEGEDGEK